MRVLGLGIWGFGLPKGFGSFKSAAVPRLVFVKAQAPVSKKTGPSNLGHCQVGSYRHTSLIEGLYTYRSLIEALYTLNSPPVVSFNLTPWSLSLRHRATVWGLGLRLSLRDI